jgi:hypothetical protein
MHKKMVDLLLDGGQSGPPSRHRKGIEARVIGVSLRVDHLVENIDRVPTVGSHGLRSKARGMGVRIIQKKPTHQCRVGLDSVLSGLTDRMCMLKIPDSWLFSYLLCSTTNKQNRKTTNESESPQ